MMDAVTVDVIVMTDWQEAGRGRWMGGRDGERRELGEAGEDKDGLGGWEVIFRWEARR